MTVHFSASFSYIVINTSQAVRGSGGWCPFHVCCFKQKLCWGHNDGQKLFVQCATSDLWSTSWPVYSLCNCTTL